MQPIEDLLAEISNVVKDWTAKVDVAEVLNAALSNIQNGFDTIKSFGAKCLVWDMSTVSTIASCLMVVLAVLIANVPPKVLGSFKLEKGKKEVDLIDSDSGAVLDSTPGSFRPEICSVRRLGDGGISCFNGEAALSNLAELLPVGDSPMDPSQWYFLEASGIESNETLHSYLDKEPDTNNFEYNGQQACAFLSFKLAAGSRLPNGFEDHFDNDPVGQWTIRRRNFDPFDAHFCDIGGGFRYAMIPALVGMGWVFQGLILRAGAEPPSFQSSFDRDTWTLASIVYDYFSCLSTKALVHDANVVLSDLSVGGYVRETCGPITTTLLRRVLDDLLMCCDEQELEVVCKFRRGVNDALSTSLAHAR
eukprot:gene16632-11898_t